MSAALSLALLVSSGWFWSSYRDLRSGLRRSNALQVLGAAAPRSRHGDMNILLIGLDSRRNMDGSPLTPAESAPLHAGDSEAGYNTNTLILMHIPGDGARATAISIPRDDYVAVPGYGMLKIKEAYGSAKADADGRLLQQGVGEPQREQLARDAGRRATLATIHNLLGVPIDHFAEVNLIGFYDIVQAIGPVTVCLDHPVDDQRYSGAHFPAGVQSLDAGQALSFVRQRHGLPNGDLDRTHRQQAFISAVTHKLRSDGVIGDLGKMQGLIDVVRKDVVLDETLDPITFAGEAQSLTAGRVDFYTLPIEGFGVRNGEDVNLVDPARLRREVTALFDDQPHAGSPSHTATPATPATVPGAGQDTVSVLNGSDTQGLAASTSRQLATDGFRTGAVGSLPTQPDTTVTYGAGAGAGATVVAARLHVHARADPDLDPDTITVDLGTDADPAVAPAGAQGAGIHVAGGIPCVN